MAVLIADAGPTFWHTVYLWIKTAAPSPKPELVRVNPDSPLDRIRGHLGVCVIGAFRGLCSTNG